MSQQPSYEGQLALELDPTFWPKISTENSSSVVVGAEMYIGPYSYRSKWALTISSYEILLVMPWYVSEKPHINYDEHASYVGSKRLPTILESTDRVKICNMGVKKFGSFLRNQKQQVFRSSISTSITASADQGDRNPGLIGDPSEIITSNQQ